MTLHNKRVYRCRRFTSRRRNMVNHLCHAFSRCFLLQYACSLEVKICCRRWMQARWTHTHQTHILALKSSPYSSEILWVGSMVPCIEVIRSFNCEICSFSGFAAPNGRRSWDLRQRRTGKSKYYRKDEKNRKGLGSQVLQREFCAAGEVSEEKNTIDAPCCNRSDETESKSARPSCLNTLALGKKTSLTEVSPWAQGVLKDSRACRKDWKCSTWLRVCLCQRSVE